MRTTSANARPVQRGIESLETRKLFAGFWQSLPVPHEHFNADAVDVPYAHPGGYGGFGGERALVFGGGAMRLIIIQDPTLVITAFSTTPATDTPASNAANNAGNNAVLPAAARAAEDAVAPATANDAATRVFVNAAPSTATPVVVKSAANGDVVDATPAIAMNTSADSNADTAPNAMRFSFVTVGALADHTAHPSSGLADLLNSRPVAASTFVETAAIPAGRSGATRSTAAQADADLDTAAAVLPVAEQATLAALPGPLNVGQPLWQRLAVATAGAVLVSANWVVRRRARKLSVAQGRNDKVAI